MRCPVRLSHSNLKNMESLNKEEYEAKDRAFYSAMISAWLNTKIERDKQLLGLSSTAIGLLVTLLRTFGASNSLQKFLFAFALLSFLITVIAVVCILDRNAVHIQEVLNKSKTQDKCLMVLDKVAAFSFIIGMILVIIIGLNSAVINSSEKKVTMSQEQKINAHRQGIEDKKSFNGVSDLRPQSPKDPQTPLTAPNTPSPPTSPKSNESGNSNETSGKN
ncbi:hypothetical protein NIES4103_50150 [Nostoc sp. NIES-4103]|nr:hypothetical protein NIES4103_50150 [Nostoc sp. NIES-4103]